MNRPVPCCWLSLVLAVLAVAGCGGDARPAAEDGLRRYHDGQRWVEVTVMLDRLDVERIPASQAGASTGTTTRTLVFQPAPSLAALESQARALKTDAECVEVYACLLPAGADPAVEQPMRLTRRLTLTGAPGQDLAVLAARHGARVVEKAHRADTVICQATAPSLLAALDAANALREEPGVVAATPLIARQHQPRSR